MVLGMLLDARSSCLILALVFESRVSKMVPGSRRAWVSVSRLFHGILSAAVNTSWSERAEVNRLSMGISGRWTSVGLGTRGVSLGTDASLRTTRADAGVAVASAVVAVSSSSPFSLSLSLFCFFSVLSSRFLCPISIYPFPRVSTYRGSESGRRLSSTSEIDTILLLLLLFSRITSLTMASARR